jgi:hypothetical protein
MNLLTLFVLHKADLEVQQTEARLLNESSSLAATLGVTKFVNIIMILVILCCPNYLIVYVFQRNITRNTTATTTTTNGTPATGTISIGHRYNAYVRIDCNVNQPNSPVK